MARFAAGTYAFLERRFQADRLVVFLQEVLEGFVGKLLKGLSLLTRDRVDRLPRLIVELHALPRHSRTFRVKRIFALFCAPASKTQL
jgi:hypothetical protein